MEVIGLEAEVEKLVKEQMNLSTTTLFIYEYPSGDMGCNIVRPCDIKHHIEYNRVFRPGRLLYMVTSDKKLVRLNNGCIKEEYLGKYDDKAIEFYINHEINMFIASCTYN